MIRVRDAAVLLCVAAVAACSAGAPSANPTTPTTTASTTPTSLTASTTDVPALALWPETDRSVVPSAFPGWRDSAVDTTSHFASAILGWPHPVVQAIHSTFNVGKGVRAFAVSPRRSAHAIEVHAMTVFDDRHWSVTYMWGFGKQEPTASVSIDRGHGDITFGYWSKAASAKLLVTYGRNRLELKSSSEAHWSFPLRFPIDVSGAVMVLFQDRAGEVFTGWGTGLSAGRFSAG